MLTLHGFAYSNYYNIPKHALLFKGVEFAEDLVYPGAEGYRRLNPAGKVPSMTTAAGEHLAEASVLCEYIEETYPTPALFPSHAYSRNHMRQIMRCSELYLELACRRLLPFVFSKAPAPESLRDEVNASVDRGVASLNGLCAIGPYLTGAELTMADIYLRYVLSVVDAGASVLKRNIVAEINGLSDWRERMAQDPISQRVDADTAANKASFFAYMASGG